MPPDRWDSPAPCDDWVARDVVRHMVDNGQLFLGFVGQELPPGPSVDDDPAGAWANARDAVQAALDGSGGRHRRVRRHDGDRQTFEKSDRSASARPISWSTPWDLAQRATGGDERLDPDEVHAVFER